jgi:hypothetical protein
MELNMFTTIYVLKEEMKQEDRKGVCSMFSLTNVLIHSLKKQYRKQSNVQETIKLLIYIVSLTCANEHLNTLKGMYSANPRP